MNGPDIELEDRREPGGGVEWTAWAVLAVAIVAMFVVGWLTTG